VARLFVLVFSVHHPQQPLLLGLPKYFSLIEVVAREAILVPPPLPCLTKILAEKNPLSECLLRGNSSLQVLNYSNFITILVRIQHLLHEFKSCSNLFHFKEKNWFVVFFSQDFLFSFLGHMIF